MTLHPRTAHVIEDRAEYDADWRLVARTGGQYDVKPEEQPSGCHCPQCDAWCACEQEAK